MPLGCCLGVRSANSIWMNEEISKLRSVGCTDWKSVLCKSLIKSELNNVKIYSCITHKAKKNTYYFKHNLVTTPFQTFSICGDGDSKQKVNHQIYHVQQSNWLLSLQGRTSSFSTPSLHYRHYTFLREDFWSDASSPIKVSLPQPPFWQTFCFANRPKNRSKNLLESYVKEHLSMHNIYYFCHQRTGNICLLAIMTLSSDSNTAG